MVSLLGTAAELRANRNCVSRAELGPARMRMKEICRSPFPQSVRLRFSPLSARESDLQPHRKTKAGQNNRTLLPRLSLDTSRSPAEIRNLRMRSHRKKNRFVGQIKFNPHNGHSGQQGWLRKLRRAARSVSDFDLPSRRFTQCAKVIVHRPRMTKNKTRHKPENGIVNLAVLRDPHDGIFSIGLE